MPQLRRTQR
ncbi:hypothetical protein GBAR_LOCUS3638 [Geodia barretti]|uniref:Uncharacterized protein n=1 Tax=Geodia barretti TaxID=519541 RepID=A0AA35W743_GEOBA|nr:hypothetical protein GBAR_LOCUS3638 [Geodia barretti]